MVNFNRFRFWGRNPLTIVEFIIAVASIIGGVYVASPLIIYSSLVNGATPLVAALAHPVALVAFGVLLALSGIIVIAGIFMHRYRWRANGLFLNILLRIYGIIVTFLIQGLLPLTWLATLTVTIIALVCYLYDRGMLFVKVDDS